MNTSPRLLSSVRRRFLGSWSGPLLLSLLLLVPVATSLAQPAPGLEGWNPPEAGVKKLKDGLNGSFTAKGGSNTTTPTPWRVLLEGTDIYGNEFYYQVARGTVPAIPGTTNEPNTVEIPFGGSIPNDGTLHNYDGTDTNNLPAGYSLALYFGEATVTEAGDSRPASTNGYLVSVVPDLLIPPVQQVTKGQAGARALLATNANGSVRISSLVITNPGSGYNLAAPPAFAFTPQGGGATNAAAVATNSVIVDPQTGSLLEASVGTNNNYAATVTNVVVAIAAPPRYQTQRTGGVLYGLNEETGLYNYAWNPGDAARFQTTIANNLVGETGRQSRPMRPVAADLFRLRTILTTDPAYSGEAGSDDLLVFEQDCAGDMAGRVSALSEVRAIKAYNTPAALPTYGVVPVGAVPATATATMDAGGRITGYIVTAPGGYDPSNPPPVTVVGDGFGATAQAVVDPSTGEITAITPVSFGQGYTTAAVTIAPPVYGARYYQPRPDDGFLDIGEQVELAYDVLVPANYTGIYFVGAKVDALNSIAEPLDTITAGSVYKESPPLQASGLVNNNNNTFVSDVATRIQILSVPNTPRIDIVSQVTAPSGAPIVQSDGDSDIAGVDESGAYVVFESSATDLAVAQSEASALYGTSLNNTPPLWAATNTASTNGSSIDTAITNGLSNGLRQIFRRNTADYSVELVSVSSGGAVAGRDARNACTSTNGAQIAFESAAPNLVDNDTGGSSDIFVRRLDNFRTVRVSVNSTGTQGNAGSVTPSISGSGRFVAFASQATNLDDNTPKASGTAGQAIFVHDRDTDDDKLLDEVGAIATYAVSVNASGQLADGWCDSPKISEDGEYVVFVSYSGNMPLPAGYEPANGYRGLVYRVKLDQGKPVTSSVDLVSITHDNKLPGSDSENGSIPALSYEPVINGDGMKVAFTSFGNNLVAGDENGFADVFVRDYDSYTVPTTIRVSLANDRFAIGRIAFPNAAGGLLPQIPAANNPGEGDQIVLSDGSKTVSFTFKLAPVAFSPTAYDVMIGGTASQTRSNLAAVINTANAAGHLGIRAVPDSPANVDPYYYAVPTRPGQADIPGLFLFCMEPGALGNVPIGVPGLTQASSVNGVTRGLMPSGVGIQFSGMDDGGVEAGSDAGEIDGVPAGSTMPSIDRSGMIVAFRSTMQTLDVYEKSLNGLNGLRKGDVMRTLLNKSANIYVRNRDADGRGAGQPDAVGNASTKRVSVSRFGDPTRKTLGSPSSANNHKPNVSLSGRYIAFSSDSDNTGGLVFAPKSNLTPQDTNQKRDVFVYDRATVAEPPPVDSNNAPSVTLTEPAWLNRAELSRGSKITINALVTDIEGHPIDKVFFYINGKEVEAKRVNSLPTAPAPYLTYGDYYSAEVTMVNKSDSNTIVARATDNPPLASGLQPRTGTSPPITFATVDAIPMPISVAMLPLPPGAILETGKPVILQARAALPAIPYFWDIAVVRFYANGILIGTDTTISSTQSSDVAEITWYPPLAKSGVVLSAVASTIYGFNSLLTTDVSSTLYSAPLPPVDILGIDEAAEPDSPQGQVLDVFETVLSRPPDGTQNQYWVDAIAEGTTPAEMVMQLIFEDEYTALQNKLFGYYYKMGVAPVQTTYLNRLGLMAATAGLDDTDPDLSSGAGYPVVNSYDAPYGATTGDATAAQQIIASAAFAAANPGVQTKSRQDFMVWYFSRWPGAATGPSELLLAAMNSYAPSTEAKGYAASFINALNAVNGSGPGSAYDYQLKATSLQWLYTGIWAAPTVPPVTTLAQLEAFVTNLLDGVGSTSSAPRLYATSTIPGFSTAQGTPSAAQALYVSAQNLTGQVTVAAPTGFQVSLNGSTFADSVEFAASATQPVYVRVSALASAGSLRRSARVSATGVASRDVLLEAEVSGNPFLPVADLYLGTFGDGVLDATFAAKNGLLSLATRGDGTFGGTVFLNGLRHSFSGRFGADNLAAVNIVRKGQSPVLLNLDFDTQRPSQKVVATVTIGDAVSATVALPRGFTGKAGSIHPKAGKRYSLALPAPDAAFVHGFASLSVAANGSVTVSGTSGDGTAFSVASAALDGDNDGIDGYWIVPVYAAPYGVGGCLAGEIYIAKDEAASNPDVTGNLAWIRPPVPAYPSGFRRALSPVGQAYALTSYISMISDTWSPAPFALKIDQRGLLLPSAIGQLGSWPASNLPTLSAPVANGLSLLFTGTTGQITGRILVPSVSRKALAYRGVAFSEPVDLPGSLPLHGIGILQTPAGPVDVEITD